MFPPIRDTFVKDTDFIPESLFKDVIETLINENDAEKNQKLKEILSEENIGKASVKRKISDRLIAEHLEASKPMSVK